MKWRIGDVTVTKVVEMEVTGGSRFILPQATYEEILPIKWLQPHFADERGRLKMSIHALVIEAPGGGEERAAHRRRHLPRQRQDKAAASRPGTICTCRFFADLEAAGFPRKSIDTVLCTHLHVDHVGWNTMLVDGKWVPTFPKARYLMGRVEFAHWRAQHERARTWTAVFANSVKPVHDAGLVDLVETDHRITNEISLIPTIGHTPGPCQRGHQVEGRRGADHRRFHAPSLPDRPAALVLDRRQRPGNGADAPASACWRNLSSPAGAGDRHAFRRRHRRPDRQGRRYVPDGCLKELINGSEYAKGNRVSERIFDGLKVIDCASFIAGPAAATVMSDFGAEVVKIEPPGMGDPYRRRGTPAPGRPALNPGFFFDARNKRSLALDLRHGGRARGALPLG